MKGRRYSFYREKKATWVVVLLLSTALLVKEITFGIISVCSYTKYRRGQLSTLNGSTKPLSVIINGPDQGG